MKLKDKFKEWLAKQNPPRQPSGIATELWDFIDFLDENYAIRARATRAKPTTTRVWEAYEQAFSRRWRRLPVRNAMINGQLAHLVARVGADDAAALVEYYVSQVNEAFYTRDFHPVGLLLRNCEGMLIRMRGATHLTRRQAQQLEQADATVKASKTYLEEKHGSRDDGTRNQDMAPVLPG